MTAAGYLMNISILPETMLCIDVFSGGSATNPICYCLTSQSSPSSPSFNHYLQLLLGEPPPVAVVCWDADGVGFIFSNKLPCPKNIQKKLGGKWRGSTWHSWLQRWTIWFHIPSAYWKIRPSTWSIYRTAWLMFGPGRHHRIGWHGLRWELPKWWRQQFQESSHTRVPGIDPLNGVTWERQCFPVAFQWITQLSDHVNW